LTERLHPLTWVAHYLLIILILLVWAFPIFLIVISSFKPSAAIINQTFALWFSPTLDHYRVIFESHNFGRYVINSLTVSVGATFIVGVCSFLTAYSLARFRTGGESLLLWVLITRMAPPAAILMPFYLMFRMTGLTNTLTALVIVNISLNLSFAIWLLKTFIEEIPRELEESARIDGASYLDALSQIVLPLVRPGIITTLIFVFVFTWNEYLFALTLASSGRVKTLPVAAGDFVTAYAIEWGPVFGAGTLILIPIVLAVFVVQRYIVRGLTVGALK
jgi:multiple sugar transport system permease protein